MRPRAGRPAKPSAERLHNRVSCLLTDKELAALEQACGEESMSGFLRRILLRYLARRRK